MGEKGECVKKEGGRGIKSVGAMWVLSCALVGEKNVHLKQQD